MRRLLGVLFCCCLFLLLSVTQLMGCGDKVLALGRAVRLRYASNHSASILLYLRPGSSTAASFPCRGKRDAGETACGAAR